MTTPAEATPSEGAPTMNCSPGRSAALNEESGPIRTTPPTSAAIIFLIVIASYIP